MGSVVWDCLQDRSGAVIRPGAGGPGFAGAVPAGSAANPRPPVNKPGPAGPFPARRQTLAAPGRVRSADSHGTDLF